MLILAFPAGCVPAALEWNGKRFELPGSSTKRLLLAGFGTSELSFSCKLDDAGERPGRVELFEIDALPESAAREWIDKRPSEFVPISWGDVSIVRSTLEL